MSIPTDLSDITAPNIVFSRHPRNSGITEQFNSIYGMTMDTADWESLFTGTNMANTASKTTILEDIRTIITENIIFPEATNTRGADDAEKIAAIKLIVDSCTLKVCLSSNYSTRIRNKASFDGALTAIERKPSLADKMYIEVNIAGLYFNPNLDEMDYKDFSDDHIRTTAFPGGPARPTGAGILTTADITSAVVAGMASSSGSIAYGGSVLNKYVGPNSAYVFNHNNLPDDVKERYLAWKDRKPIAGTTISTMYSSSDYYFEDPTSIGSTPAGVPTGNAERITLTDGTLFIV